jgi:hypothetical protein
MDELPSFWTLLPGFLAGSLFIGRLARWLQFVLATMGKGGASLAPEPNPRPWKAALAVVAYPTPWIAVALVAWAIHHALVAPFTMEWRWFYVGFFGGPILLMAFLLFKVRQLKRKRKNPMVPPA